eukprot:6828596-Ditylum_brightwellii.AAC.1
MEKSCLPRKFINNWYPKACPVGGPLTTIHHTYLQALQLIGEILEDDEDGRLNDWMPTIWKDPPTWECRRLELTPHIIGYVPPIK